MSKEKLSIEKIMAVLAQPKEAPPPLVDVEQRRIEVPYITKENKVEKRPVRLYVPTKAHLPMPLIFVPHYEMGDDSLELRDYLAKGWMVASPTDFHNKFNGQLTDDDLVFNNAALYTLRRLPEVDINRIALVGGSAGGYMTLMLNALQLGICCSLANCPVTNVYYNFYRYWQEANKLNEQALVKIMADKDTKVTSPEKHESLPELMSSVVKLPIPFLAALYKLFIPNMNNFPDPDDYKRWEAFSPVALTDLFCSPILIAHFTSDTLVPIDQISKRFTYDKPGDSLPEDFNSRLPESYPGKLKYSLEERLPAGDTRVECLDAEVVETEGRFRFDADKRFNLNIYDDGPVEGFGSHRSTASTGRVEDTEYLETLLSRTAAKTNILTPEKLRSFLERYQGKSVQLPAHEGIDDEVYGSLNIYRKEVIEHLAYWTNNNGNKALNEVFEAVLKAEDNEDCRKSLQVTFDEIINSL